MKHLWIAGAGGFGRELYHWIHQHPSMGEHWRFCGFLDDNLKALHGFNYPEVQVHPIDGFAPSEDDLVVMGIGMPLVRKRVAERLLAVGVTFLTFVHPTALIGGNVTLGKGCVLCPHAIVTADSTLGDFVLLNISAHVAHDCKVGDYVTLSPNCDITGNVTVEEGVFWGVNSSVIPGVCVGKWSTIGAGSVLMRSIAEGKTAIGVPAKATP